MVTWMSDTVPYCRCDECVEPLNRNLNKCVCLLFTVGPCYVLRYVIHRSRFPAKNPNRPKTESFKKKNIEHRTNISKHNATP